MQPSRISQHGAVQQRSGRGTFRPRRGRDPGAGWRALEAMSAEERSEGTGATAAADEGVGMSLARGSRFRFASSVPGTGSHPQTLALLWREG